MAFTEDRDRRALKASLSQVLLGEARTLGNKAKEKVAFRPRKVIPNLLLPRYTALTMQLII